MGPGWSKVKKASFPSHGLWLDSLENEIFLYKSYMGNNIRALEKIFVIEKLDFVYCTNCKYGKTKSGKTILENNNLKVTVLPKKRILFNFEYYFFLVWLWKSWDIEKAYELFYYIRCIRKVVYDRVLMIP